MSELRALFLTPQLPYPPRQGSALRNYYLIKGLAEHGVKVDLLSFATAAQVVDPTSGGPLRQLCGAIGLVPLPPPRAIPTRLRTLLLGQPDMAARLASPLFQSALYEMISHRYDVVQVEGLEMAQYGQLALELARHRPRLILDEHNAEYALQRTVYQTDLRHPRRVVKGLYSLVQYRRLMRFEREACRRADAVIAVSPADAQTIAALDPQLAARIRVIPNGVDTAEFNPTPLPAPTPDWPEQSIVFTGLMEYRPNVDAAVWFAEAVWPKVRAAAPAAQFYIVGARPNVAVRGLAARAGVVVTGEVDDVRPYISAATVYVVPMRMGGGVRLKFLQALAMGKAVICTALGAEGVDIQPEHDIIVANDADEFATAILSLLKDKQHREELGRCAVKVAQQFDWQNLFPRLLSLYHAGQ